MDLESLPSIALEGTVAAKLGVAPNGLIRMVDEGTLPKPFARRGDRPVWSENDIIDFFGQLHDEQSAYAPIDRDLGQSELKQLGAYVCPADSSSHIGNRRPSYLALYEAGEPRNDDGLYEIGVYPVLWVQTQRGVAGETIAAPPGITASTVTPVPWSKVRPEDGDKPRTLFKLDTESRQTLLVRTGVRRGGTISTSSLMAALSATPKRASHFKGGVVHLSE